MKTSRFLLTLALFAATAITGLQPISAKVLYVGTGSQWAGKAAGDIHATPHAAFAAATEGDEIWIAEGTYEIAAKFNMKGKLVSFYGGFIGTENSITERAKTPNGKGWEFTHPTILKVAQSITYVFDFDEPSSTSTSNLSISGLMLDGSGYNTYAFWWATTTPLPDLDVSIKNCIIKNFGSIGVDTDVDGAGLRITGTAAYKSFVVDSCLIENNVGRTGGGVHVQGPKTIKNCIIRNNTASNDGGGIYAYQGTAAADAGLTITGCLIDGNAAAFYGAGINVRDVSTKYNIHNCIVVNNSTPSRGGGIYFGEAGSGTVIAKCSNLTIANNGGYYGAGIYFRKAGVGVYNSIFYNNKDTPNSVENVNCYGQPAAFSNNIIDKDDGIISASGCISTSDGAAIFGPNWVTLPSSPGTNNGTASMDENFTLPDIDYAGKTRVQGTIDIGPYEYDAITDDESPTPPTNLTLKGASKTTLTLEWGKSTDDILLNGYVISVNNTAVDTVKLINLEASLLESNKICYALATGLTANSSYSISVQAIDWANNLSAAATGTFSTNSSGRVWYVGSGWQGKPFNSLKADPKAAFAAATEGDEIWIAEGTYNIASTINIASKLVSFYGSFAGTENSVGEREKVPNGKGWEFAHPTTFKQTVAMSSGWHMFDAYNPGSAPNNVAIDGLILDGNGYNNSGISWYAYKEFLNLNVSIKNCIVKNFGSEENTYSGAGMDITGTAAYSSFVVDSCLIENNVGSKGGGVHIEGPRTLKNSIIRHNTASGSGGGIYAEQGTAAAGTGLTITGCLIDGNTAATSGGGMYIKDICTKYNIHNCIVVNNETPLGSSNYGGGIYLGDAGSEPVIAKISNLTIANNKAYYGAGIYFRKAGVGVYNSIFYNNKDTPNSVENVRCYYSCQPAAFSNNIIDKAYGITSTPGCIFTSDSAAIFGQNWVTLRLSPATEQGTTALGDNFTLSEVDYAGNPRIQDAIDIGPYEYEGDHTPPTAPATLALKGASKTTLTLEWSNNSTDDILLKGYVISVGGAAVDTIKLANLAANLRESEKICYTLTTGLPTPNTPYSISVQAIDWAGNLSAAATGSFSTNSSGRIWYVGSGWQGKPFNSIMADPRTTFTTAAAEGDEIWIAAGTYNITYAFNMSSKLVSFYGSFVGTENSVGEREKVLNGKSWEFTHPTTFCLTRTIPSNYHMFDVYNHPATAEADNVTIDGLILDGRGYGSRGIEWRTNNAIPNLDVSIKNCIIKNFGSVDSTTIDGAGISIYGTAAYKSFAVDSCLIENNVGKLGGGVYAEGAKTIKNSTIRNNTASERGGGIYAPQGTAADGTGLTITGCLIDGNTATTYGGGMFIRDLSSKYNIHSCIVVNNSTPSGGSGGGIYFGSVAGANPIATISNLTIANNRAPAGGGGGIRFGKDGGRVYNSIFYNNWQGATATVENVNTAWGQPAAFSNNIIDADYGITSMTDCIIPTSDGAAIFGPSWVTLPSSPGTDKGTSNVGENFTLPEVDYAGNPRVLGNAIDIGPYEYEVIGDVTPPTDPTTLTLTDASKATLTLEWGKSTDDILLKGYVIFVNSVATDTMTLASLNEDFLDSARMRYLLTGLAPSASYSISVRAIDWANNLSVGEAAGSFSTTNTDGREKVWYVGSSWQGKPFNRMKASLYDAYNAAAAGDEIWIAEGTYNITSKFDMTTKLVSFYGGFAGTESFITERVKVENGKGWEFAHPTVLKQTAGFAGGMFYVWNIASTAATNFSLDGLVMEGYSDNNSGLLWIGSTNLSSLAISVRNCWIKNFDNTSSGYSGGLYLKGTASYSSFVVESCLIENNVGSNGGGVYVEGAKTIKSCIIRNNTASGSGGGIYAFQGTAADGIGLTITGCLIDGNTADAADGGGIYVRNVSTRYNIHNCILVNNRASADGGGIYFHSDGTDPVIAKISNLTIANNYAVNGAGICFNKGGIGVYNSIFYNNVYESILENIFSYKDCKPEPFSNNIIDTDYGITAASGCIFTSDSAAIFGQNWATLRLSPGVEKGTTALGGNFTLPEVDYAGTPRVKDTIDIGPYEYNGDYTPPTAPANLALKGASKTTLTLEWSNNSTDDILLKGYVIFVGDAAVDTVTLAELDASLRGSETILHLLTGLAANTSHSISVRSIDWASNISAGAATGSFSTTNTDGNDKVWYVGSSWVEKPFNRLKASPKAAYDAAAAGDEIWIAGGDYSITDALNMASKLVSFYGGFAGTENSIGERAKTPNGKGWEFTHPTTLRNAASNNIFYIDNPASVPADTTISINGLTLDGNSYNARGIYWHVGTALPSLHVSVKNCIVQNFGSAGSTVNGAGIALGGTVAYGSFVIDSCLIQNNTGNNGGGVYFEGNKILQNCEIRNNVAAHASPTAPTDAESQAGCGGGIFFYQGATDNTGKIYSCLIEGNTAYSGGGVFLRNAYSSNIHGCVVVNNTATHGGGVSFSGVEYGMNARFVNFTIAANRATEYGAGVYFANTEQQVYNTIFWNNINTSTGTVENVYLPSSSLAAKFNNNIIDREYADLTLTNCIVSSDSAAIFGENWGTMPGSIAEDEGSCDVDDAAIPATDFAGGERIVGDTIDIGAYERQIDAGAPHTPEIISATPNNTSIALLWTAAPGGVPAEGYYIYIDKRPVDTVASDATTCTVSGLTPGATYVVQMAAFGADGKFSLKTPRKAHVVTTLNGEPPSIPQNIKIDGVAVKGGTASVKLSWSASTDDGTVAGYNVHVTENSPYSYSWTEPLTSGTSYTVSYLYAGSSYTFKVSATDNGGVTSNQSAGVLQAISATDGSTGEAGVGEGKNPATLYPMTVALKQTPNMVGEMKRLGHMQKKYDRQPTGFYVEKNKKFTVKFETVTEAISGETEKPTLYIGTYGYYNENTQKITLTSADQNITANQSGMIWLQYTSSREGIKPTGEVKVIFSDGSKVLKRVPRYILGVTTEDEFAAMMNRYQSAPSAVLESDYIVVVPSRSSALKNSMSISKQQWLNDMDRLLALEDSIGGLDDDDVNAVHHRLSGGIRHAGLEYEGIPGVFASASAFGYIHFTGENSHYFLKPFGTFSEFYVTNYLWGLAHEIGHQHQQSNYFIDDASEATVNIYSYVVIRDIMKNRFNKPFNRIPARDWTTARSAGGYLALPKAERVYPKSNAPETTNGLDSHTLRFMVWEQLFLVFGDEFYHRLHRLTREAGELYPAPNPAYSNDGFELYDEDRKAFLIRVASQATGYDLRGYFDEWGIRVTDNTKKSAMNATIDAAISAGTISSSLPNSLTVADLMAVNDVTALPAWAPLPLKGIKETGSQQLSKKNWTIILNSLTVSGTNYKENIIDGSDTTLFTSSNKTANGGFTIDFHDTLAFNSFTYTQPSSGSTNLRATKVSLLGSNDGATFTPIAADVTLTTGSGATTTKSFTTAAYRYVKLEYKAYGSGSGVSIAEFDLGLTSFYSKVTAGGDEHVTITSPAPAAQPFSHLRGKDLNVNFTLAENYRIKEVKIHHVGGAPIAPPAPVKIADGYSLTIHNVLADSIGVEITTDRPKVTVSATEFITITAPATAGSSPYSYDGSYEKPFAITFSVAPSHENPVATVNGAPVALVNSEGAYTLTIGKVTTDTTVSITASRRILRVTTIADAGISVTTANNTATPGVDSVAYGSAHSISFSLKAGYVNPQVKIGGNAPYTPTPSENVYTVTVGAVTSDTTIRITSEIQKFTVSVKDSTGIKGDLSTLTIGSGTPSLAGGNHQVSYDSTVTLTFSLHPGYVNPKVYVNGSLSEDGLSSSGGAYTWRKANVRADMSIVVLAEIQTFRVTVIAGDGIAGYALTPTSGVSGDASPYTVKYDSTFALTYTLKTGYTNPKVQLGSNQPYANSEQTVSLKITSDTSITLSASIKTFEVTVSKTAGIENVTLASTNGV
ncbi:MAG: fibronectin type III domain-containing protein, partial [Prevotellaceae bacterium]|nr:fibronectin type III domain-containing protein [Prevotellaceae bacterium]